VVDVFDTNPRKQLIFPFKMANRFIPYVPKPTNEKYSSKPLCKNVRKQPTTASIHTDFGEYDHE
jgi:hypothetical protein